MDMSQFSDSDLKAIAANDMSKMSDEGLAMLAGGKTPQVNLTLPSATYDRENTRQDITGDPRAPKGDGITIATFGDAPRAVKPVDETELRSLSAEQKARDWWHTILYNTSKNTLPVAGAALADIVASPAILAAGAVNPALGAGAAVTSNTLGYAGGKALHNTLFPQRKTLQEIVSGMGADLTEGAEMAMAGPILANGTKMLYKQFISPEVAAAKRMLKDTDLPVFEANRRAAGEVLQDIPGSQLTIGQQTNDPRILAMERATINAPDPFNAAVDSVARQPSANTLRQVQKAGNVSAIRGALENTIPGSADDAINALAAQARASKQVLDAVPNQTIGSTGKEIVGKATAKQEIDRATKDALYADIPNYDIPLNNVRSEINRIKGMAYDGATQQEINSVVNALENITKNEKLTGVEKMQAVQRTLSQRYNGTAPGAISEFENLGAAVKADRQAFDDAVQAGDVMLHNDSLVYRSKLNDQRAALAKQADDLSTEISGLPAGYDIDALRKELMLSKDVPQIAKDTLIPSKNMSQQQAEERVVEAYRKYIGEPVTADDPRLAGLTQRLNDRTAGISNIDNILANAQPAEELTAKAKAANDFYKNEYAPKYKNGAMGEVLQKGNQSNALNMTDEAIGQKFTQSPTQAQDLIRTVGKDEAANIMKKWYQSEVSRMSSEGVSAQQIQGFVNRNKEVLKTYGILPEVHQMATVAREYEAVSKVAGMDASKFVESYLTKQDNGKAAAQMMARLRGNPDAIKGVQRMTSEYLQKKMLSTEVLDGADGLKQMAIKLRDYNKQLDIVYANNPQGLKTIKQAQQLLVMQSRIDKVQGTPGSPTATEIKGLASGLMRTFGGTLISGGGAAGLASLKTGAGPAALVGVGAGMAYKAREYAIQRYITRAMFDPAAAKELIMAYKGSPAAREAAGKKITALMQAGVSSMRGNPREEDADN